MATSAEYMRFIKCVCREDLIKLWEDCLNDTYDKVFWNDGKLLEYIVLRGFELEREGCVTYPYNVIDPDSEYKKHDTGESNEDLMHEAGYLEIYDCGQSTYIWTVK